MPVQRLKVATLPLDLPWSGQVTHSGEILTTGKVHGKKPDRFSLNDNTGAENVSWFNLQTPNVAYSWPTAPLTSKFAFYIFIKQI